MLSIQVIFLGGLLGLFNTAEASFEYLDGKEIFMRRLSSR
jgi:hypothetical protein